MIIFTAPLDLGQRPGNIEKCKIKFVKYTFLFLYTLAGYVLYVWIKKTYQILTGEEESQQLECKGYKVYKVPAVLMLVSLGSWVVHHTLVVAHPYGCASHPDATFWFSENKPHLCN